MIILSGANNALSNQRLHLRGLIVILQSCLFIFLSGLVVKVMTFRQLVFQYPTHMCI